MKVRTKQEEKREHQGDSEDVDLQRLVADPDLRRQGASAMSAAL